MSGSLGICRHRHSGTTSHSRETQQQYASCQHHPPPAFWPHDTPNNEGVTIAHTNNGAPPNDLVIRGYLLSIDEGSATKRVGEEK